jgi:hypothetical protein
LCIFQSTPNEKDGKGNIIFLSTLSQRISITSKDGEKEEVKRELLNDSVKVSFNDTKNTTSTLNTPSRNSETLTVEMKGVQTVRISDIDMPFVSMVIFIIKWTIASIPALIILMILFAIFGGFIMAIFN